MTNSEMIDSMIVDCNEAVKAVASGQMIQWCRIMYEMVLKLSNLKNGIRAELQNRDENITMLKNMLKDAGIEFQEIDLKDLEGKNNA